MNFTIMELKVRSGASVVIRTKMGHLLKKGKKLNYYRRRVNRNLKTVDDANAVVRTLSDKEKKLLRAPLDEDWITKEREIENSSATAKRIISKVGDVPVSMLEIYDIDDIGEIAIATDSRYRGKGYAAKNVEKAKAFVNSKRNTKINELLWSAHKDNLASQNLAVKSGFNEIPNTFYGDTMNPDYKYYRYVRKT